MTETLLVCATLAASLSLVVALIAKIDQRVEFAVGYQDDAAALASVATCRATSRHVESSAWLPLRVDLAGQDVSVFDPNCINAWTGTILHRRTIVRTSGRRR